MAVGIFKPSGHLPSLELETCREATPNSILSKLFKTSTTLWFDFFFFFCGEEFIQQDNELKHTWKLWQIYLKTKKGSWVSWTVSTVLYSHMTASPLNIYGVTWRLRKPSTVWHHILDYCQILLGKHESSVFAQTCGVSASSSACCH